MRTIKLKAKSIATGQWLFGFYMAVFENHEIIGFGGERYEVDPETVCQFTGVLDSEKNEIYEGDTCMLTASDDFSDPRYSNMCGVRTVYYRVNAGQFLFEDYVPLNWGGWKYVKILHNIHDYAGKP